MTSSGRVRPSARGSEPRLSPRELLHYRVLGTLAALIILGLGIAHRMIDAGSVDPLWERMLVAGTTLAAVGLSFVYRRPGYRYVVYGVYSLITLWVVHLVVLNDFAVDYALSIFIVVSGISTLFRSSRALGVYLLTTVLAVAAAGVAVQDPANVRMSRVLYVIDVTLVCVLLYVIMSTRLSAEDELRDTEAYYRALIENAEDAIVVIDERDRLSYVSPSASRVLGYAAAELEGRSPLALVHGDDRGRFRSELEEVASDPGRTVSIALGMVRADGEVRHMECAIHNLLHDPAVEGIVVNARDVTERKRLEEELRRSQKMEAIGRLAGGVAHDFNNLLTVITGQTQYLLEDLPTDSELRDDAREILDASERAADVTRQLLAVGKRQAMEPVVFDAGQRVSEMETMLRNLTDEKTKLRLEVEDSPIRVKADPSQLERVVVNLVVNARDAMAEGGRITLRVGIDDTASLARPGARDPGEEGPFCVLSVSDTGEGIPEEDQERIFEPFFTTKDDGTGLGLATVYGVVEQSGGTIEVESEPGRGTSFRVFLPLAADVEERASSLTSGPTA